MSAGKKKPNLLLIMDDQHRFDWLGCAGASFVQTPNLDRLAARGTRFTNCFTNSPVCAPARVSLATGRMPHRLGPVGNNVYLPRDVPTYFQHLRDEGMYRVGCCGKLDLVKPDGYNGRHGDRPRLFRWGFTHPIECEGKMHAGKSPEPKGPYGYWLQEQALYNQFHEDYVFRAKNDFALSCHDSVLPKEAFEDIYIGRRSAEWIREIPNDFPWHFFVSFVGPHDPFDPPAEYAEPYRKADMPKAIPHCPEGKPARYCARTTDLDKITETRRQYAGSITAIDDAVGEIMAALEARGELDNTHVVFSSDHGEMAGDHGMYTKSVPYEAAIHVPLIVAGPGLPEGKVSDALVELMDVNPTLIELAGLPAQEGVEARSLVPVLQGHASTHRDSIVTTLRSFECIRTERYKYVNNYGDIRELYDLEEDPSELHNLCGERPEIAHELGMQLAQRLATPNDVH